MGIATVQSYLYAMGEWADPNLNFHKTDTSKDKKDHFPEKMAEKQRNLNFGEVLNPSEKEEDSPIRAIFCLKKCTDIELFDASEDCFILDFNPFETADLSKPHDDGFRLVDESDDLVVLSEKGQVACRDYPHSRHLCLKFPFQTASHEKYCKLCYCYVCDVAAPCKFWSGAEGHCHATAKNPCGSVGAFH